MKFASKIWRVLIAYSESDSGSGVAQNRMAHARFKLV